MSIREKYRKCDYTKDVFAHAPNTCSIPPLENTYKNIYAPSYQSELWKFHQTVLLDIIYKKCKEIEHRPYIICIGSTTDRVKKGGAWLYNAEKKALRDYCNTLGINGVWENAPKITLISFGSLTNVQSKHPTRRCLEIERAAMYIKWLIEQPKDICINEISIDPLQVIS